MAPGTHGHAGSSSSGHGQHHDQAGKHGQADSHDDRGNVHGGGSGLDVSPDVVPALRSSFFDAMTKIDRQIELAGGDLRQSSWAQDPISQDAAEIFNNHSVNPDGSALDMLRAYRSELEAAVSALDAISNQYEAMEQDNSVTVGQQPGGEA
ncbi:transcriptional regulator [Labedaea rhizosphaerae]|uniref:PE family protein n=1 Tax=Labedaea rhizosphaerae TaxID=598644 RepID=A0A4R6S3H9_LABRH|nr:transcriptional regulator [Labedaea rhizosphaerae]TDP93637.1 hypothetical protein EV186_10631 [Labedaea rhizosphaerae]